MDIEIEDEVDMTVDIAEKVVGKRVRNNKIEYLVLWKDCENKTWESEDNLNCDDLIAEYLQKENCSSSLSDAAAVADQLIPDEIVGVSKQDNKIGLLMKWKNSPYTSLIPSKQANIKYPELVIKFYEKRILWQK